MKELTYPFNPDYLLKKKKSIKKKLGGGGINGNSFIDKNIAILGGSTTNDIKLILELFLLNYGIKPSFYESEYNRYYEDGMFPNPELEKFSPDIIYICTSNRNITDYPQLTDSGEQVEQKLSEVVDKFTGLWEHLWDTYHCPVIQNNFEYPFFRLMGNKDASDRHGRVNFVTRLNCRIYEYAQEREDFYICDIN